MFIAHVFNAEQIDGVPPAPTRECSWDPLEKAEQLVQAANPKLQHAAGDRAYYRPSTDSIHLPLKEQFPSAENYYSTLLHEPTAPLLVGETRQAVQLIDLAGGKNR